MANLVEADVAVGERFLIEALDRAADVAPAAVDAARAASSTTHSRRRGARRSVSWPGRRAALTPSRFPVEIAVTSASPELRTTVEVVAPEDDKAAAFGRAIELAEQFGSVGLVASHRLAMERHQRTLVLRFGAWLSSRHDGRVDASQAVRRGRRRRAATPGRWSIGWLPTRDVCSAASARCASSGCPSTAARASRSTYDHPRSIHSSSPASSDEPDSATVPSASNAAMSGGGGTHTVRSTARTTA